MLDTLVKPKPILLKPKTTGIPTSSASSCVTPPGSKRNLSISFGEVEPDPKKFRSDVSGEKRPLTSRITRRECQVEALTVSPATHLLGCRTASSSPQSAMGYLVMAAGLEVHVHIL